MAIDAYDLGIRTPEEQAEADRRMTQAGHGLYFERHHLLRDDEEGDALYVRAGQECGELAPPNAGVPAVRVIISAGVPRETVERLLGKILAQLDEADAAAERDWDAQITTMMREMRGTETGNGAAAPTWDGTPQPGGVGLGHTIHAVA